MGELNIYGVYVPTLLIQAVIAYVMLSVLMKWLDRLVTHDWIIMPNLFYVCIYLLLLGIVHWAGLLL